MFFNTPFDLRSVKVDTLIERDQIKCRKEEVTPLQENNQISQM